MGDDIKEMALQNMIMKKVPSYGVLTYKTKSYHCYVMLKPGTFIL